MLVFPRHACLKGNHWGELQSYNSPRICLTTNLMSKCQEHTILGQKSHDRLPSCHPSSSITTRQPSEQTALLMVDPNLFCKVSPDRSSPLSELTALHYCCMSSCDKPSRTKMRSLCVCAAPTNSDTCKVITKLGGGLTKIICVESSEFKRTSLKEANELVSKGVEVRREI